MQHGWHNLWCLEHDKLYCSNDNAINIYSNSFTSGAQMPLASRKMQDPPRICSLFKQIIHNVFQTRILYGYTSWPTVRDWLAGRRTGVPANWRSSAMQFSCLTNAVVNGLNLYNYTICVPQSGRLPVFFQTSPLLTGSDHILNAISSTTKALQGLPLTRWNLRNINKDNTVGYMPGLWRQDNPRLKLTRG